MDETNMNTTERTRELPAFLHPLLERMHSSAKAETVFGPSREEQGRTIVPVARVAYGWGGGFGSAAKKKPKDGAAQPQPDEGAGGGGGITVTPLGVLEVTDAGTTFVPLRTPKLIALGALLAGMIFGLIIGRATGR